MITASTINGLINFDLIYIIRLRILLSDSMYFSKISADLSAGFSSLLHVFTFFCKLIKCKDLQYRYYLYLSSRYTYMYSNIGDFAMTTHYFVFFREPFKSIFAGDLQIPAGNGLDSKVKVRSTVLHYTGPRNQYNIDPVPSVTSASSLLTRGSPTRKPRTYCTCFIYI